MKCKKCNTELIEYRNGDITEYICPVCDETPATQEDHLIEYDSNKYIVKIVPGKQYDKDLLKRIASVCSCNMLEAKRILESVGYAFKSMDALDTRALKHRLEEIGAPYDIDPEFRW